MHLIPRIIDGLFSFLDTLRKQHRLDWLINNRDLFPTVLEAGSSRSGCQIVDFVLYFHVAERVQATSLATSLRALCARTLRHFSRVRLCVTLWTATRQAPLSVGFSRQESWSVLPCPPPGDLPKPGIKSASLKSTCTADMFFTPSTIWEALIRALIPFTRVLLL